MICTSKSKVIAPAARRAPSHPGPAITPLARWHRRALRPPELPSTATTKPATEPEPPLRSRQPVAPRPPATDKNSRRLLPQRQEQRLRATCQAAAAGFGASVRTHNSNAIPAAMPQRRPTDAQTRTRRRLLRTPKLRAKPLFHALRRFARPIRRQRSQIFQKLPVVFSYRTPFARAHFLHQQRPSPMQARPHRSNRTSQRARRFGVIPFVQIAQHHHFAIRRRQRQHRLPQRFNAFVPRQVARRSSCSAVSRPAYSLSGSSSTVI